MQIKRPPFTGCGFGENAGRGCGRREKKGAGTSRDAGGREEGEVSKKVQEEEKELKGGCGGGKERWGGGGEEDGGVKRKEKGEDGKGRRSMGGGTGQRQKRATGSCDRGGKVIFCSVVSFQKGLAGLRNRWMEEEWRSGGVGGSWCLRQ